MRDAIFTVLGVITLILTLALGVPLLGYYWAEYLDWVFGT